jgi:hypothetical protein
MEMLTCQRNSSFKRFHLVQEQVSAITISILVAQNEENL